MTSIPIDYEDDVGGGEGGCVCTNFMMIVSTLVCKIGWRGMRAVIADMSDTRVYGSLSVRSFQCVLILVLVADWYLLILFSFSFFVV